MIELKVGDRVRVGDCKQLPNSYFWVGKITDIVGYCIRLDQTDEWYHRWQVRKLVKVRKCYYCAGLGKIYAAIILDQKHPEPVKCQKCNGKGKMKV